LSYRQSRFGELAYQKHMRLFGGRPMNTLFPDDPSMPPGCSIKGKFAARAKLTGHRGIYHLEGCGSYQRTKKPDRWFCSEDDAQAAGFRNAFTCRS
jgi:hypothetical protein